MAKAMSKKKVQPRGKTEEAYPDEEQGPFHKDSPEQKRLHMKVGEDDEDIYEKEGREALEEDDEIAPWEEGFTAGASGLGQLGKDALTGEPLMGADNIIELEYQGKMYRFVSKKNAEKFLQKKKNKEKR